MSRKKSGRVGRWEWGRAELAEPQMSRVLHGDREQGGTWRRGGHACTRMGFSGSELGGSGEQGLAVA